MLQRVREPEIMDDPGDVRAYEDMDLAEVNQRFVQELAEFAPQSGRMLDLGTGPADIPIQLAKQLRRATVVAVDLAPNMLATAQNRVEEAAVADRVELLSMDVKGLSFRDSSFDVVFSNSTAHHIPDPLAFFREANRVCRPEGLLFIRDLRRPESRREWRLLVDRFAPQDDQRQRQLFADSLMASLSIPEVEALAEEAQMGKVHVFASSERHWTLIRHPEWTG